MRNINLVGLPFLLSIVISPIVTDVASAAAACARLLSVRARVNELTKMGCLT